MTIDASNVTITTISEDPATGDTVKVVDGVEVERIAPTLERTNERTILTKMDQALTANATFLAIATPTNAQIAAQVKLLTREVNAIIKLTRNQLDDTTGT